MRLLLVILSVLLLTRNAAQAESLGFHDETEVGLAVTSGNSTSESYNLKQMSSYAWELDLVKASGRYLNTRSGGATTAMVDTALSWDATLRYERVLSPVISVFASYGLESDIFAGYVQRNNGDLGAKYFFAKSDPTTWSLEAGYRNSYTHYPASLPDISSSFVRLYSEIVQNITKTASFKFYVEYLQTLSSGLNGTAGYSESADYYINSEPSISLALTEIFSIKTSYLFKYRNYLPVTAVRHLDSFLTSSIQAKF